MDRVCVVSDCDVGDVGIDVVALSRSAKRHACEQYTFPLHSRSQAMQKSRKQSMLCDDANSRLDVRLEYSNEW